MWLVLTLQTARLLSVWVMVSTDVQEQSPLHSASTTCSVWTQSAEVTGSVREPSAHVTRRGLEWCARLSTAPALTAVDTATARTVSACLVAIFNP